jgi:hypothetical protein
MNALARYEGGTLARAGGNVVEFAAGGVAAAVRVERVDRKRRSSWYAIRLASTDAEVTGRLLGVHRNGEITDLGGIAVAPGSVGSARLAVVAPHAGTYRSMFLEIRSDNVLVRVDAPVPPSSSSFGIRPWKAGAALAAAGAVAMCGGLVALAMPRDPMLAAPSRAVPVPHVRLPHAVAAPPALARITSFAARRDPGAAGDTVLVSYLAVGERGTVALLDAAGNVVTSAPFAHVGTNRLPVPHAFQSQPMTARITVHRGTTVADASVAIAPGATPQPSASPDALASIAPGTAAADVPEAVTPIDAMSSRTSGGAIAIVGRALAGHPLVLHVAASSSPMQVELQDEAGGTLAETTIAARATSAVLPLPPATAPVTYFVALHYARNGGEETVVRTVVAATR